MVYLNSDEEVRFNESAFISLLGLGKIHGHLRRGGRLVAGGREGIKDDTRARTWPRRLPVGRTRTWQALECSPCIRARGKGEKGAGGWCKVVKKRKREREREIERRSAYRSGTKRGNGLIVIVLVVREGCARLNEGEKGRQSRL